MSDTPRTDACWDNERCNIVIVMHARQLERELAEVTKQRNELLEALEKLLNRSYQFTDEGPLMEGWKSDEFTAEIEQAESAIAKVKGGAQ